MTVLFSRSEFDNFNPAEGGVQYNNKIMPRLRKRRRSDKEFTGIDVELKKRDEYNYVNSKVAKGLIFNDETFYQEYLLEAEVNKRLAKITKEQMFIFMVSYLKGIIHKIIFEGYIWAMPYGLGRMFCKKGNKQGFKKSMVNGKFRSVIPIHFETFRKLYFIRWSKEHAYLKNKPVWTFRRSLYFKNQLVEKVGRHIGGEQFLAHDHNETKWT